MTLSIRQIEDTFSMYLDQNITINGWVRTVRSSNARGFMSVSDGTFFVPVQVVFEPELGNFETLTKTAIGSAVSVTGMLVESPAQGQKYEVKATEIKILADSEPDFPLQKKRHTFEYLRTIAHLRPRTNTFQAVFRLRSKLSYAIHQFFQEKNFVHVHSPIITCSDCEGAGEMFQVTTLDLNNVPKNEQKEPDFKQDFFQAQAGLTVSGQLNAEAYALAFRDVYTFGPTFRAENSNTSRHAAEFWMVEPEMSFADLNDDMNLAESMIKYLITTALETLPEEMEFFNQFVDQGLIQRLEHVRASEFERISYTKAVDILEKSGQSFEFPVAWGIDLQSEHEQWLCEKLGRPVIVTDYPAAFKAFYMRMNDDQKTVAAMDMLVPGVGEIIGGSQREERLDILDARMKDMHLDPEDLWWYRDLRRFGGVQHAGFGLGFERLIQYVSGMTNIRDVIPFPRTPRNASF